MQRNRIIYRASVRMLPSFSREAFIKAANIYAGLNGEWDGRNCWKRDGFTGSSSKDSLAFRYFHDGVSEECTYRDGMLATSMFAKDIPGDFPRSFANTVASRMCKDEKTGWEGASPIVLGLKDKERIRDIQSGRLRAERPIIYLTCSSKTFHPIVNTRLLAEDVSGLFLIVEEKEIGMQKALQDSSSSWISPYNGAIDIYWPEGGWSRINPARWNHLDSDGIARTAMMNCCALHRYAPPAISQPDVAIKGLSETAGVEYTGNETLPDTLKAIRNDFDSRTEKLKEEYESYTKEIEKENSEAKAQASAAGNEIRRLKGLLERTSTDTTDIQLACDENEFYQGELKDIIVEALDRYLKMNSDPNLKERRSYHVLSSVIRMNPVSKERKRLIDEITNTLTGSGKSTKDDERQMLRLGFEKAVDRQGTHLKFLYHGDPRYTMMMASSPSDSRAGNNKARGIIRRLFQ